MDNSLIAEYYNRILPAIPLFLMIGAIIIGFDCIWRVEKRLDTFLKLLTMAMIANAARKALITFGYSDIQHWLVYMQYIDVVSSILFLAAIAEMYRIIRSLNKEK